MTRQQQHPLLGVGLIVAMTVCFAVMDTTIRWLGSVLPVLLLTARQLVQAVPMALRLAPDPRRGFRTAHLRFQALRGNLLLVTSGFSFVGLRYVPVAEATAIFMLTPMRVTLLAATVLHGRVSARAGRWWAAASSARSSSSARARVSSAGRCCCRWRAWWPMPYSSC